MAQPHLRLQFGKRQAGSNGGCDTGCECIQPTFAFEDDFCSRPPVVGQDNNDHWTNNSVGIGSSVILLSRSGGWWELRSAQGPTTTNFRTLGECFGVPAVPGQKLLVKTHVAMDQALPVFELQGFHWGLQGFGTSGPVAFEFFMGGGPNWSVQITDGGFPLLVPTAIPVSTDCKTPDVLKILATSTLVRFFINEVLVHSLVPTANILSANLNVFYMLTQQSAIGTQAVATDLFCSRVSRFCRTAIQG